MSEKSDESRKLSIDDLSGETGVPSRTIRFYQARGVLDKPVRKGRKAVYTGAHVERLKVVAEMQNRGLTLRAIRDVLERSGDGSLEEWLGVGESLGQLSMDAPTLLTERELHTLVGKRPGIVTQLIEADLVERQGLGARSRYLVRSPVLVKMAVTLEQAGVEVRMSEKLYDILGKHMGHAADEMVELAVKELGKGFGRGGRAADVGKSLAALFPDKIASEAVRFAFHHELQRAIEERFNRGAKAGAKADPQTRRGRSRRR